MLLNILGKLKQKLLLERNSQLSFIKGNLRCFAAPVTTFAIFTALPRNEFTISKAFTSITLISLLEQSSMMLIGSLPTFSGALGCFARLEKFLL